MSSPTSSQSPFTQAVSLTPAKRVIKLPHETGLDVPGSIDLNRIMRSPITNLSEDDLFARAYLQKYHGFVPHDKAQDPNALMDRIDVVACDNTANWFPMDPLADIYAHRGREVDKLKWRRHIHFQNTPFKDDFSEVDNTDLQATTYFVQRFVTGDIACVVRMHPSLDSFGRDITMLSNNLPYLLERPFPVAHDFFETSRVIVDDERLPPVQKDEFGNDIEDEAGEKIKNPTRGQAARNCLAASILWANQLGIKGFGCFMPEAIWGATYIKMGMTVEALGPSILMNDDPTKLPEEDEDAYLVYAGTMQFTPEAMESVRRVSGFDESKFNFGRSPAQIAQNIIDLRAGIDAAPGVQTRAWTPPGADMTGG